MMKKRTAACSSCPVEAACQASVWNEVPTSRKSPDQRLSIANHCVGCERELIDVMGWQSWGEVYTPPADCPRDRRVSAMICSECNILVESWEGRNGRREARLDAARGLLASIFGRGEDSASSSVKSFFEVDIPRIDGLHDPAAMTITSRLTGWFEELPQYQDTTAAEDLTSILRAGLMAEEASLILYLMKMNVDDSGTPQEQATFLVSCWLQYHLVRGRRTSLAWCRVPTDRRHELRASWAAFIARDILGSDQEAPQ